MSKPLARTITVNSTRLSLFGPPALLNGEDGEAYDSLMARISGALNPADIIEEMWVRDIVDLNWEILRLRRFKSQFLTANLPYGLRAILDPVCGYREADELSTGWAKRDGDAIKKVDKLLADAGLTMDEVWAETLAVKINDFERIDRLIMSAEMRRDAILGEIERRRARQAELRKKTGGVEDAEFVEVPCQ